MKTLLNYVKGFAYILVPFLLLTIFITLFYYFNLFSPAVVKYLKMIVPILSMLIGGIYIGRRSKEKGWLEGLKVGLIFLVFLFLFSYLGFQEEMHLRTWIYYLILLISSMLGSMIGINKRKA